MLCLIRFSGFSVSGLGSLSLEKFYCSSSRDLIFCALQLIDAAMMTGLPFAIYVQTWGLGGYYWGLSRKGRTGFRTRSILIEILMHQDLLSGSHCDHDLLILYHRKIQDLALIPHTSKSVPEKNRIELDRKAYVMFHYVGTNTCSSVVPKEQTIRANTANTKNFNAFFHLFLM